MTLYSNDLKHLSINNVDITYENESNEDIAKLIDDINEFRGFFDNIAVTNYQEPFSIKIMPSVWALTSSFNVDSKVGAVYTNSSAYMQPLVNLKSRNKYRKTLFIEYAHYFIDLVTDKNCPLWLNEGLSYYLWLLYSGERGITTVEKMNIEDLKLFSTYMNRPEKMKIYYSSVVLFLNNILRDENDIGAFLLKLKDSDFKYE